MYSASAADAAAVNTNGIKTLLANASITLFLNGTPVFNNGPRGLPRNPSDYIILDNWVLIWDNWDNSCVILLSFTSW